MNRAATQVNVAVITTLTAWCVGGCRQFYSSSGISLGPLFVAAASFGGRTKAWPTTFSSSTSVLFCRQPRLTTTTTSINSSRPMPSSPQASPHATDASKGALLLVDVDCNLLHPDLQPLFPLRSDSADEDTLMFHRLLDQDQVENIAAIISPGSTMEESARSVELLGKRKTTSPILFTTVGVHPYHAGTLHKENEEFVIETMKRLILSPEASSLVVAVGECGLDTSDGFPDLHEVQIPAFLAQIKLAADLGRALYIHERGAHQEMLNLLAGYYDGRTKDNKVLIHCFTGNMEECQEYISRGYYISLSGHVCKEESVDTIAAIRHIPLDRLMIETDAPYMGFAGCRSVYLEANADKMATLSSKKKKKLVNSYYPNVPSSLLSVLRRVHQEVHKASPDITLEDLARITSLNANRFFDLRIAELEAKEADGN